MMSIQTHQLKTQRISNYLWYRKESKGETMQVQKIDSIRDPKRNRVKSLKVMVRIDNQII